MGVMGWAWRGVAAGAAGTTALNAAGYLDMVVRGRDASTTPDRTVEKLAALVDVDIPGESTARANRTSALGALTGIIAGVGVGKVLGLARAAGFQPGPVTGVLVAAAAAMLTSNAGMVVLGVTDPRQWSGADWAADVVPHLAYGLATQATLSALDPG